MTSPTQRSKAHLEKAGYRVIIVEKWIPIPNHPAGGQRKDAWGFGDLIAKRRGETGSLIVQTTSGSNVSARVTKILTECRDDAMLVLETGDRIIVHGWRRLKQKRGSKAVRWHPIERLITLADFDEQAKARALEAAKTAEEEACEFVESQS